MWMQYQGFGKYKIYPKKMGIDMLSVSGHKIHGPKGIGFIYINEKAKVKPIIFGGEQQKNMRSGTENVPGIAGIGLAAKTIYTDLDEKVAHMRALKQHFIEGVQKIDHTVIHGLMMKQVHHISSVWDLQESGVRFFFIHWKRRGFMYHPVRHVHPTIRRSAEC